MAKIGSSAMRAATVQRVHHLQLVYSESTPEVAFLLRNLSRTPMNMIQHVVVLFRVLVCGSPMWIKVDHFSHSD